MPATEPRPDYGLDAPGLVRGFGIGSLLTGATAAVLMGLGLSVGIEGALLGMSVSFGAAAAAMVLSSRVGKLRARDRLLDNLDLSGDERVLDLGCGRGLLLIGAASRLPRGQAVGVDLWSNTDLSDNAREATIENARRANVLDRVDVHDGDMRKLAFEDDHFDAVVACFSIHNIEDAAGRAQAMAELDRVLRPGGKVALLDFRFIAEHAQTLVKHGYADVTVGGLSFLTYPPARTVRATKPVTSQRT